jgi:hypothetical protein
VGVCIEMGIGPLSVYKKYKRGEAYGQTDSRESLS